jgi:hypothetical protein
VSEVGVAPALDSHGEVGDEEAGYPHGGILTVAGAMLFDVVWHFFSETKAADSRLMMDG